MIRLLLLTIFLLVYHFNGISQSIVINEIVASNDGCYRDGFGESDDWVELFNPTQNPINIGGFYISNDPSNPTKHRISNSRPYWTTIQPNSFLILWLDRDPEQGTRHINFSIKKRGSISIYNSDTILVDQVNYHHLSHDISFGRISPNANHFGVFELPTPNSPNKDGLFIPSDQHIIEFSHESGVYPTSVDISLKTAVQSQIYYTLDGSEPTINDSLYKQPIKIDSTRTLRARIIQKNHIPNDRVYTHSYFIGESTTLPILSLTTDPDHLWSDKRGIYSNYEKRGWERPAEIEYFDIDNKNQHQKAFSKTVDIRIAGKTSRRQPKKSIAMFSNDNDGQDRIHYPIFSDKAIESFNGIWVRADATSGLNVPELWVGERFKNELLYEVNKQMNGHVDMQAYQPVLFFINGRYWGLYNLMERKGADFIKNNHPEVEQVDILTAEDTKEVRGSQLEYDHLIAYASMMDTREDSVFHYLEALMDMDSYIDYWINETYCGAHDISVNIRYWKDRMPGGKWRWISYDQDSWNEADENTFQYYIDEGEVFLFGRLMRNERFRNRWINRMSDYLNTGFSSENVISLVDQITHRVAAEIDREKKRWSDTMLYVPKGERITWIKDYAKKRPTHIREQIISYFELDKQTSTVQVEQNLDQGFIQVNSLNIDQKSSWTGTYFQDIPITISAIPKKGYKFVKWKNKKFPVSSTIQIKLSKKVKITPVFEQVKESENLVQSSK